MDGFSIFVQCQYFKTNFETTPFWQPFNGWTRAVPPLSNIIWLFLSRTKNARGKVMLGSLRAVAVPSLFRQTLRVSSLSTSFGTVKGSHRASCCKFLKYGLMWLLCSACVKYGPAVFKNQPSAGCCFGPVGADSWATRLINLSTERTVQLLGAWPSFTEKPLLHRRQPWIHRKDKGKLSF